MGDETKHTYQFGRFCLDTSEQTLLMDGKPVPLPPKVLDTLTILVKRSGHVVSKDEIMAAVWGDTFVEESSLTRNISLLRKALQEETSEKYIQTVPKRGYRFVAPVRIIEVDTSAIEAMNQENGHQPQGFNLEPIDPRHDESPLVIAVPASTSLLRRYWFLAGLVVLTTLFLTGGLVWHRSIKGNFYREWVWSLRTRASRPDPIQSAAPANDNASTASVKAYQKYRIGYYFWSKRGNSNIAKAIQYFRQATEEDPNYALAYSMLTDSYMMDAFYGYGNVSLQEAYDKGKQAATKALQLDNTLPEAHIAAAVIKNLEGDRIGEEQSYQHAIRLNPSLPLARLRYGYLLASTSRLTEAIAELRTAEELDPASSVICGALGGYLLLARQYDDAIKYNQLALELDPENYTARDSLGWAYSGKGMYDQANVEFDLLAQAPGFDQLAAAGSAYVATRKGLLREARERLAQIVMKSEKENPRALTSFLTSLQVAKVFCALGEKEEALDWLHRTGPIARTQPYQLEYSIELEPLKTDTRFAQIIEDPGPPVLVVTYRTE